MADVKWGEIVKDAEDVGEFTTIPDGDYDFTVASVETKTTKNGKTMFVIKAQITSGPYKGRLIFDNVTISPENPKALGFALSTFAAIGLSRDYFAQNSPSNSQIEIALTGRPFRGTVGKREYQGKDYNEIKKHSPAQTGGIVGGPAAPTLPTGVVPPPPPPAPVVAATTAVNAPADPALAVSTPVAEVPAAPVAASVPAAPF